MLFHKAEIILTFKLCNVYSHKECKDCFAKLYCSGGCAANAYHSVKFEYVTVSNAGCAGSLPPFLSQPAIQLSTAQTISRHKKHDTFCFLFFINPPCIIQFRTALLSLFRFLYHASFLKEADSIL